MFILQNVKYILQRVETKQSYTRARNNRKF